MSLRGSLFLLVCKMSNIAKPNVVDGILVDTNSRVLSSAILSTLRQNRLVLLRSGVGLGFAE